MEKEELKELANNEEFQSLVSTTSIGGRFKFNGRYFQIVKMDMQLTACHYCVFKDTFKGRCLGTYCGATRRIDEKNINIKEISEIEYRRKNITTGQLEDIANNNEDYHIIFERQNVIEPHEFGIDEELKKKICKVMIDYYNKN